jgi:predicted metalloprotease
MRAPRLSLIVALLAALVATALPPAAAARTAPAGTGPSAPSATSGAAAPLPKGKAALTANPIYRTGKLQLKECKELPVNEDDLDSARVYLEYLLDCLNESWSRQLAKAKLPFAAPRFQVISKVGLSACGRFPQGAQAVYCPNKRTIVFLLDKSILTDTWELFLFEVMAHEYGHHVQELTGMFRAADSLRVRSRAGLLDQSRRIELQAECFSAAFIGSVWHSLGRSDFDFKYIVKLAKQGHDHKTHGKGRNIAYWLQRGFDSESPGACNTWAAPKSRVA